MAPDAATSESPPPLDSEIVIVTRGGESSAWVERLRAALPGVPLHIFSQDAIRESDTEAQLTAVMRNATCALIDGQCAVSMVARRLNDASPTVQVAVIAKAEDREGVRRSLLFAPGLGELWINTPHGVGLDLITRAAEVTHQRRRYQAMHNRIAASATLTLPPSSAKAERAFASEAFLAGLLRVLPDPVFTLDENGRVLSANDAGDRLFDAAPAADRQSSLWKLLRPERPEVLATLADLSSTAVFMAVVRYRDGTDGNWEVRVASVRAGELRARAVVAHDLTEQSRLEQRLRDQAADLVLRTEAAERARTEAEAARREADKANISKSQFLATMSHELRTPLNAIGGYAELLEQGVYGPVLDDQRTALQRIYRSQQHLLGLINDILTFAKLDAGVMTYAEQEVALADTLGVCEALILPELLAKKLTFEYSGCDRTVIARADRDKVHQVVLNLLSNAVKFTNAGGRITMTCGRSVEGRIVVTIGDTGRGIAEEDLARVFEPFVQVDALLTRTEEGTGLGLAISRNLARGMGGDLTVESMLGAGSTFRFTLRPHDVPAEPPQADG